MAAVLPRHMIRLAHFAIRHSLVSPPATLGQWFPGSTPHSRKGLRFGEANSYITKQGMGGQGGTEVETEPAAAPCTDATFVQVTEVASHMSSQSHPQRWTDDQNQHSF